jgi:hypothetical protein
MSVGATGWSYVVPYQQDMGKVLEDLKGEVFLQGDYQKPSIDMSFLDEIGFFDADEETRESMFSEYTLGPLREPIQRFGLDGLRDWLEKLDAAPKVQNREELAALQCLSWEGTWSILDIGGVTTEPSAGDIFPLPPEAIIQYFGTDRPERGMLPAWRQRWDQWPGESLPYERGQGIYFVLYQNGQPAEIYVEGSSGD